MKLFFNFFSSWVRLQWARYRGFKILASPDEQQRRLNICYPCRYYRDGLCMACGCLTYAKVALASEKCPKKYWLSIWVKKLTVI